MKKILFFILLIVSIQSFGQGTYKGESKIGEIIYYDGYFIKNNHFTTTPTGFQTRIVNERIQGGFMVDSLMIMPRYSDTTEANLHKRFDTCGSYFFSYTKDSVYYRACNPKRWICLGSGGGSGGFFNPDQTSTGNTSHDANYKSFDVTKMLSGHWKAGTGVNYMDEAYDSTYHAMVVQNGSDFYGWEANKGTGNKFMKLFARTSSKDGILTVKGDSIVFDQTDGDYRFKHLTSGSAGDSIMVVGTDGKAKKMSGVAYNFTSLADWDLLRYKSSTNEFVNYKSTYIDPSTPTLVQLVRDTVTGEQFHIPVSGSSSGIQELDTLTDLDSASGNAAIIDGRLWIKNSSVGSWSRQAYDTTYTPTVELLLDTYSGAAAALSLRLLRTAYSGSAIRVRRSSDNAEQDIGFVSGYLDTASLKTFVGANDGRIVTWYDQSGNSIDGSQSTSGNQPYILTSGAFLYVNGNVTIDFGDDTNPYYLVLPTGFLNGATSLSYFHVAKIANWLSSNGGVFAPSNTNSLGLEVLQLGATFGYTCLRINGTQRSNTSPPDNLWQDNIQSLTSIFGNASSVAAFNNSASVSIASSAAMPSLNFNGVYAIGIYNSTATDMSGNIQELVIYTTDKTSDRTGIEGNINTFYTIF